MSTDLDATFAEAVYTAGFRARCHLGDLPVAFSDSTHIAAPDPVLCHADEHPEQFAALMDSWNRCLNAASVIQSRHDADMEKGGIIAAVAGEGRDGSMRALTAAWKGMYDNYIAATLDSQRKPWDCLFCGEPVDPEQWGGNYVDADRCPNCYCILWMNRDETDWTNEWEETR
ncbi:MAG: hypothetical protein E6R06_18785 [Mycobacterium sp.]|nr:MAG: hypothetical protein E6R06_18785 [Mycobacterium sp.]